MLSFIDIWWPIYFQQVAGFFLHTSNRFAATFTFKAWRDLVQSEKLDRLMGQHSDLQRRISHQMRAQKGAVVTAAAGFAAHRRSVLLQLVLHRWQSVAKEAKLIFHYRENHAAQVKALDDHVFGANEKRREQLMRCFTMALVMDKKQQRQGVFAAWRAEAANNKEQRELLKKVLWADSLREQERVKKIAARGAVLRKMLFHDRRGTLFKCWKEWAAVVERGRHEVGGGGGGVVVVPVERRRQEVERG